MSIENIVVPDIGSADGAEVIEINITKGGHVAIDDPIVVLETDKATVEVPSTVAGEIQSIEVSVGQRVNNDDLLATVKVSGEESSSPDSKENSQEDTSNVAAEADQSSLDQRVEDSQTTAPSESLTTESFQDSEVDICVPDLGGSDHVTVVEIMVAVGDKIDIDDPVAAMESDKATMELPSTAAGTVQSIHVKLGDELQEGDLVLKLKTTGQAAAGKVTSSSAPPAAKQENEVAPKVVKTASVQAAAPVVAELAGKLEKVHAGPAVRKLARELGADLSRVLGTGPRKRILKDDLNQYIKQQVKQAQSGSVGGGLPNVKLPDFSQFGDIERQPLSRIHRLTAENMQTSWLTVPHVTQFDKADITDLEVFRKAQKPAAEKMGVRLTPLPFILKAVAYVLKQMPQFNVSLDMDSQEIIQKKYIHIGVAVDTPAGLVVPVIRDVDKKGIWELAKESYDLAIKARDKKLMPGEMQGGCFTISSLGSVGGTAFTPIVNTPEVAILGLSKAEFQPVFTDGEFIPRLMLPLSLSYDHRAVNGADAARFCVSLSAVLKDLRHLLF